MSGRLALAALMARASLRADCGNSVPELHEARPVGGDEPAARDRVRLQAEKAHGEAADVRVPYHGGVGAAPVCPALQRRGVGVGDRTQHGADVEWLLALGIALLREHIADSREVAVGQRRVR